MSETSADPHHSSDWFEHPKPKNGAFSLSFERVVTKDDGHNAYEDKRQGQTITEVGAFAKSYRWDGCRCG